MKRVVACFLLSICLLCACTSYAQGETQPAAADAEAAEPSYGLAGEKIGALLGTTCETYARETYTEATILSFDSMGDAMQALKSGKIDYAIGTRSDAVNYLRADAGYRIAADDLSPSTACIAIAKGNPALVEQINALLDRYEADGTLKRLNDHWIRPDGSPYVIETIPAVTEGPTLRVAICSTLEPICFVKDGEAVGLDMELIRRIAYDLGYQLTFSDMQFSAIVASLEAGRADVAVAGMSSTAERAKKVDFSRDYFSDPIVLIAYDEAVAGNVPFWESLAASFHKNFIIENRWKLIVSGVGVTLLLSVCAGALGMLIGFAFCMARLGSVKALQRFTAALIRALQGTPIVVLLMILYYVAFKKTGLDGVSVAIIAFGLNFGAYVSEILRSGILAVDPGQREAALAMGYNKKQTFLKIVFPQAARHFLPVLKGEYISLVKTTSVVGYVAVQDLTKVSDMIRSRTYEAFFPLIVTAMLYFLLSNALSSLLNLVELRIDPKRRPRTLKGVKLS